MRILAIRKVQEAKLGLDVNSAHQVLTYADDVNLISDDIRTVERNADVLFPLIIFNFTTKLPIFD
jgi:hypothetical protein